MSGRSCPKCGGSDLEADPGRGDLHCTNCGLVVDDATVVSEVQFQEGRSGGVLVVGQNVTATGMVRGCGNIVGGFFGLSRESRQITLDNAERKIKEVAAQIRLNNSGISVAHNIYKRALQKRLTHGRKNTHVIAACVYMACRLDSKNNSIMLLDLSDTMQVNVYELGRTYLKLSSALHINIPTIDPCIYIIRYIHQLPNLADHKFEIESTAMRITKRMKRDWMHFGRRPSGLCGAAILVASRLHGVHCAVDDIIKVVKVCEATIRKRLNEFGDTPTSKLTLEQFMSVDLEGEEDPPCFKSSRKKIKIVTDNDLVSDEVVKKVADFEEQIEKELEKVRSKKRGRFAAFAKMAGLVTSSEDTTMSDCPSPSSRMPLRSGLRSGARSGSQADYTESLITDIVMSETIETLNQVVGEDIFSNQSSNQSLVTHSIKDNLNQNDEANNLSEENNNAISVSVNAMESGIHSDVNTRKLTHGQAVDTILPCEQVNEDGTLFHEDLDEDELDSYILDDNEAKNKEKLWVTIHADWITESAEKAKRKAEEEAEQKAKEEAEGGPSAKKKRKVKKKFNIQASSTGEAVEKMLQEKKLSNKINYAALDIIEPKSSPLMSVIRGNRMINVTPNVADVSTFSASETSGVDQSGVLERSDSISSASTSIRSTPMKSDTPAFKRLPSLKSFVPVRSTVLSRLPIRSKTPMKAPLSPTKPQTKVTVDPVEKVVPEVTRADNAIASVAEPVTMMTEIELPKAQTKEPVPSETRSDDEEEEEEDLPEETQLSIAQLMSARGGGASGESDHETDMDFEADY